MAENDHENGKTCKKWIKLLQKTENGKKKLYIKGSLKM